MADASFAGKRNLALTDAALLRRTHGTAALLAELDARLDALEAGGLGGGTITLNGGTSAAHPAGVVIINGGTS